MPFEAVGSTGADTSDVSKATKLYPQHETSISLHDDLSSSTTNIPDDTKVLTLKQVNLAENVEANQFQAITSQKADKEISTDSNVLVLVLSFL